MNMRSFIADRYKVVDEFSEGSMTSSYYCLDKRLDSKEESRKRSTFSR